MSRAVNQCKQFSRRLLTGIRRLFGQTGEPPQDPYAYAGVRNKPRLPHLSATAVLERPED